MKKETLLKYCKEKKIAIFKDATVEQIQAAIVRTFLHKTEIERNKDASCFGFWEHENSICETCDHTEKCFEAGFAMEKKRYEKKLESLENPKLSFVGKVSKPKRTRF
jgi:hypothetical protein